MSEHMIAELTTAAILRSVKILLAHNVAPAAILAMIEDMEAAEAEAQQAQREARTLLNSVFMEPMDGPRLARKEYPAEGTAP